ncbi:MAG: hypothetical protein ACQEV6_15255 [Pseudomonadota bacterium]
MNKHFFRALVRDPANRLKYGALAPRYGERIFVRADQCLYYLASSALQAHFHCRLRQGSGQVVDWWPEADQRPVVEHQKIRFCLDHWLNGVSWEEAGAFTYMMARIQESSRGHFDGCASLDDVKARYRRLDDLYRSIEAKGRFLSVEQLMPDSFREVGGVVFHLGPDGVPVFGGGGTHRFAMAIALELTIPAQLGLVHRSALERLQEYRQEPAAISETEPV